VYIYIYLNKIGLYFRNKTKPSLFTSKEVQCHQDYLPQEEDKLKSIYTQPILSNIRACLTKDGLRAYFLILSALYVPLIRNTVSFTVDVLQLKAP